MKKTKYIINFLKTFFSLFQADIKEINIDQNFIDLGLDSILGVEWIKIINLQMDISIPATKLYDYPTLRQFSEYLAKELNQNKLNMNMQTNLNKVLQQVYEGNMNIEKADEFLNNFLCRKVKIE